MRGRGRTGRQKSRGNHGAYEIFLYVVSVVLQSAAYRVASTDSRLSNTCRLNWTGRDGPRPCRRDVNDSALGRGQRCARRVVGLVGPGLCVIV